MIAGRGVYENELIQVILKIETDMITDVISDETTNNSSITNPLTVDMRMINALIHCPVTGQIFFKPVKLLLANDLDGGAIVEENIVNSLTCCPLTRQKIAKSVRAREIEYLVEWYLNFHPNAKKDQYSAPTNFLIQRPKILMTNYVLRITDIEAQEVRTLITTRIETDETQQTPSASFVLQCCHIFDYLINCYVFVGHSFILSVVPSILATEVGTLITKYNSKQNCQIVTDNIVGATSLLLSAFLLLGISEKTGYTTLKPLQHHAFFRQRIGNVMNNVPASLVLFMAHSIASGVIGKLILENASNDDTTFSQVAATSILGAGLCATIVGTAVIASKQFNCC